MPFRLWRRARRVGLSLLEYGRLRALFDPRFYLATQPDVAAAKADPEDHYCSFGWREGRDPSKGFNTIWYLQTYEDAARSGLNPLIHYVRFGMPEGRATAPRDPLATDWREQAQTNSLLPRQMRAFLEEYNAIRTSGLFQPDYYRAQLPVLQGDPIEHYLRSGSHQGLNPNPSFNGGWYLQTYGDVRISGANPFVHYLQYGVRERRRTAPSRNGELSGEPTPLLGYFRLDSTRQSELAARVAALGDSAPLISLIVPTFNSDLRFLGACIESVVDGAYPHWELIIVDDASPNEEVREFLAAMAAKESRIRTIFRSRNGNISQATNAGLEKARGSFVAFLDHDDELLPDSLLCLAESILAQPEIDAWYSDQVKCDEHGVCYEHFFKPDWSPVYLLGVMYIGHLLAVRASVVHEVGGFDSRFDGVQDFELMLRVSENTSAIGHISRPLYKWRAIPGSIAAGTNEKSGIEEKQREAVERHLQRLGRSWVARKHPALPHRLIIEPGPHTRLPKASIVIPSKDQGLVVERCLDSLFRLTDYPCFEVIIVDNGTTDPVALAAFARHPVLRVDYARKFNFSEACNLGADAASGELIVFLNNDTEVIEASWLRNLTAFFEDPDVGAVGPVLLYPDRRVQHAGVVLGARGTADHVMRFFPEEVDGYAGSLACAREVSAVTGACIVMPMKLFHEMGHFSLDFAKHYQDVDLCLKLEQRNKRILCVGNVRLIHHESVSRKAEGYDRGDRAILVDRWFETIHEGDHFFNRNLDLQTLDYSPRLGALNL